MPNDLHEWKWLVGEGQFVSRPTVYFAEYPPLADETTDQYLDRVRPLLLGQCFNVSIRTERS